MTDDGFPKMPQAPEAPATPQNKLDRKVLEALVCPVTRGLLIYDPQTQELVSQGAGLAYPIRDGIPVMLIDEARRLDD